MSRATVPKILWGSGFANVLSIAYPLDTAVSYSVPRAGSEWGQAASGVRDAWILGHDQRLSGRVRWIPTTSTVSPVASGWDDAAGWRAFLEWARARNQFRFYPDKDAGAFHACYLVEANPGPPTLESDGSRQVLLEIEDASGAAFTGY